MAKILIVEDDPLMSRMYQKIFTFEKFEVEMAHDGAEALTMVVTANPTLIMLDVMMPNMNGLEVLAKLKADEKTKHIPVIMLTNLAGQQDAETALAQGAVKYIIKSEHDPKEVTDMVKEVLAGYTRNEIPTAVTPVAPSTTTPAADDDVAAATPVAAPTPAPTTTTPVATPPDDTTPTTPTAQ